MYTFFKSPKTRIFLYIATKLVSFPKQLTLLDQQPEMNSVLCLSFFRNLTNVENPHSAGKKIAIIGGEPSSQLMCVLKRKQVIQ